MKASMDTTTFLALALDGSAAPVNEEITRLTGIAEMLETLPDPQIDPRFSARLEAVLMAEFDALHQTPALQLVKSAPAAEPKMAPNVIAFPRRGLVVRKMVAAAIAAAMLSALPIVASASALPGSPFFSITRWRQNNAISSVHGAHRAFVEEKVARQWIGYAAQMVALRYSNSLIDSTLRHAGWLQTQAALIVTRAGTHADIAKLSRMLREDARRLTEIGSQATDPTKPLVSKAIDLVARLTKSLSPSVGGGIDAPVAVTLIKPAAPEMAAGTDTKSVTVEPKAVAPAHGGTKTPAKDPAPAPAELNSTVHTGCSLLFGDVAGDTTSSASQTLCRVHDTTHSGPR
ncbi:MAG: hypothetical protein NVSMB57_04040 [Actinomycetota bacterium]